MSQLWYSGEAGFCWFSISAISACCWDAEGSSRSSIRSSRAPAGAAPRSVTDGNKGGLLAGIVTAPVLRPSPASREAEFCATADPDPDTPRLARKRTASGRPKLSLCAMFLFVHDPERRAPHSGEAERATLYLPTGYDFHTLPPFGQRACGFNALRPDCIAVERALAEVCEAGRRFFYRIPRSESTLGLASSTTNKLWQAAQSWVILLPSLAVCSPS